MILSRFLFTLILLITSELARPQPFILCLWFLQDAVAQVSRAAEVHLPLTCAQDMTHPACRLCSSMWLKAEACPNRCWGLRTRCVAIVDFNSPIFALFSLNSKYLLAQDALISSAASCDHAKVASIQALELLRPNGVWHQTNVSQHGATRGSFFFSRCHSPLFSTSSSVVLPRFHRQAAAIAVNERQALISPQ